MNELQIDDLVDQLNAVLVRHGWCISPAGTPVPDTRPGHPSEPQQPRPDAGSDAFAPAPNTRPEPPKDYAEEGAAISIDPDLERKRNRLAALLSRGKV